MEASSLGEPASNGHVGQSSSPLRSRSPDEQDEGLHGRHPKENQEASLHPERTSQASSTRLISANSPSFCPVKSGDIGSDTNQVLNLKEGRIFIGTIAKDGQISGRLTYPDGRSYVGALKQVKHGSNGLAKHGLGTFTWPEHQTYLSYTGTWKDDRMHGHGILKLVHGESYNGCWRDGKKHGKGMETWKDGRNFDGTYAEGQQVQGTLILPDGRRYSGGFRGGQRHGKGIEHWPDGSMYEGEFALGSMNGSGTKLENDGSRYQGEWSGGKKAGQGTQTWPDGRVYTGTWKSGIQRGFGVETQGNGAKYEGHFRNGQKEGKGVLMEEGRRYVGTWQKGMRWGEGTLRVEGGLTYTGMWRQDKYNGFGIQELPSGGRYQGEWKDGLQNGQGIMTGSDETRYEGTWMEGLYHGTGTLTWPDGRTYQGTFVRHKLTGQGTCIWNNGRKFIGMMKNDRPCQGEMWECDDTIWDVTCDQKRSFWLGDDPVITSRKLVSNVAQRVRQADEDEAARHELLHLASGASSSTQLLDWHDVCSSTNGLSTPFQGWSSACNLHHAVNKDQQLDYVVRVVRGPDVKLGLVKREVAALEAVERTGGHPHIAPLRGICAVGSSNDGDMCICYHVPAATCLAQHISQDSSIDLAGALTWRRRVHLVASVSSALAFLYNKVDMLHGLVTRDCVLLSASLHPYLVCLQHFYSVTQREDTEPRVAKTCEQQASGALANSEQQSRETLPSYYTCPRYAKSGVYSEQVEVYSLGVLMLEVLVGRLATAQTDLVHHFVEDQEEDLVSAADKRCGDWNPSVCDSMCKTVYECVGPQKKRPSLQTLASNLDRLCASDCILMPEDEVTMTTYRLVMPLVDGDASREVEGMATARSAHVSVPSAYARAAVASRTCVVCLEDNMPLSSSALCSGNPQHLLCAECFAGHVTCESGADQAALVLRKGRVMCPLVKTGTCTAEPFSHQEIAMRVGGSAHAAYMQAQHRLIEQKVIDELKPELEKEMRVQIGRGKVERLRHQVVDKILTLRCPNQECEQAFIDFDGCFALTCNKCSHVFCGYCLLDSGLKQSDAAHTHVTRCKLNMAPDKGLFASPAVFQEAQKLRRERKLAEFMRKLDGHVQDALLSAIEKDLTEIGIELDSVRERLRTGKP